MKASLPSFTQTEVVVYPHLREISLATMDEVVKSIAQLQEVAASEVVLMSGKFSETFTDEAVFALAGESVLVVPIIPM